MSGASLGYVSNLNMSGANDGRVEVPRRNVNFIIMTHTKHRSVHIMTAPLEAIALLVSGYSMHRESFEKHSLCTVVTKRGHD